MQAQLQSTTAARNPLETASLPSLPHTVSRNPNGTPRTVASAVPLAEGIGLAHDASNLLCALVLYSDLLARPGVLRPEHSHYATELRLLADRSGSLMRTLVSHFRATDGPLELSYGRSGSAGLVTDHATVLQQIAPLLSAIAAPAATVNIHISPHLPAVRLPAEALERILVNLVRNSAQAIERSALERPGRITVTLDCVADHLQLTVEDNGPGMVVTTAAAFLSPSPLPQGAQRGLGHRIVHQLVAASGGTLSVRVRPNCGTTFSIQWPVASGAFSAAFCPSSTSGPHHRVSHPGDPFPPVPELLHAEP